MTHLPAVMDSSISDSAQDLQLSADRIKLNQENVTYYQKFLFVSFCRVLIFVIDSYVPLISGTGQLRSYEIPKDAIH